MPHQILFKGTVLTLPGAASFTDAERLATAGISGVGAVAIVGEAEGGPGYDTNSITLVTKDNASAARELFRSGPLADAIGVAFNPANDPAVPGGASTLQCVRVNRAVQATRNLLKGAVNLVKLTTNAYGAHANLTAVTVASVVVGAGTGRVVTLQFDTNDPVVSPTLATQDSGSDTAVLVKIRYIGAGVTSTLVINGSTLVVLTGAGGLPEDSFTLDFGTYKTLKSVVDYIDALANFTAALIAPDGSERLANTLDHRGTAAPVDIKTAIVKFYGSTVDVIEWFNENQDLVVATRLATSGQDEGQVDALVKTFFTGGSVGPALANSDWQGAFDLLKQVDVEHVVPLISADSGAVLIDSVNAQADAHAAAMSGPGGNREREAHISKAGTKAVVKAAALATNSQHSTFCAQELQLTDATGTLVFFDEWGSALVVACMRAGMADEGEPLTRTFVRASAVQQDSSWSPELDGAEMLLAGITLFQKIPGGGIRIVKGVTTYSKKDNLALIDENQVVEWKAIQRRIRDRLEAKFIGKKAAVATIQAVKQEIIAGLEDERSTRQTITDSVVAGVTTRAYTDPIVSFSGGTVRYEYGVGITPGINFITGVQFLTPVAISV